jgi:hypothetical protein
MAKMEVPCEQCDAKRRALEMRGYRVLTCESKPGDSETCVLLYEPTAADAPPPKRVVAHGPKGGRKVKAKAAAKAKPKPLTKAKTKTAKKVGKTKARKARKG